MSVINTSFKILKIDLENAIMRVEYINLYGPVETGIITDPQDRSNANKNLISNLPIPVDENSDVVSNQEILDYIASQYPQDEFHRINTRKEYSANTSLVQNLDTLLNNRYDMTFNRPTHITFL